MLAGGNQYWNRELTMPMPRPTAAAIGRLRSLAAMTAAKAATITNVILPASRPMIGATSTPESPASVVLTAQTAADILPGLVPDSDVIAGESTRARICR